LFALAAALTTGGLMLAALPAQARQTPRTKSGLGHVVAAHVSPASPGSAAVAAREIGQSGLASGVVVGPATIPLAGICVTAASSATKKITRTNAAGRYFFPDMRPGLYAISFADCTHPAGAGYLPQPYRGIASEHGNHVFIRGGRPTLLSTVTLQPARPQVALATEQLRFSKATTGKGLFISGTVRSASGKPLGGVCVETWASKNFEGGSLTWYIYTRTNRSGHYSFPRQADIPAHNYRVLFTVGCGNNGNYAPQWWRRTSTGRHATLLKVKAGSTFSNIDAALMRGAIVTGTVRAINSKGTGLPGACVVGNGRGAMSGAQIFATSGRGGHYVLRGLGTGSFAIDFTPYCGLKGNYLPKSGPTVHVTDGKTVKGIDAALALGGQISGIVTSQATGLPVGGICVEFVGETANTFFQSFAATGANGKFSFGKLEPGIYQLGFAGGCGNKGSYAPQAYDGPLSNDGIITIKHGSLVTGVDVAMLAGGTVSGHVTIKAAGKAPANTCLVLDSPQSVGGLGGNISAFAYFDQPSALIFLGSHTTYSVANLEPGPYLAEFASCSFGPTPYAPEWFSPEGDGAPDWLSVTAGKVTSDVNGTLTRGGTISGKITGVSGRPLSQFCVSPQSPSDPFSALNQFFSGGSGQSGRSGTYTVTGLPAGQYAVEFAPCFGQSYAPQWFKGHGTQAAATPVPVTLGHVTAGINAVMTRGGSVAGRITSAITGLPVPLACVAVVDSSGNVVGAVLAGFGGEYDVPNLGPGTYNVEPSDCLTPLPVLAAVTSPGVHVANGHTTSGINVAMPRAGSISGTITTGNPPVPAFNTCVDAIPDGSNGQIEVALPNLDGTYALPGMAPGTYHLLFTNLCVFGDPGFADAQASASVSPGGDTTVNAVVAADGNIAGAATSAGSSSPVGGICVGAFANATATAPTEVAVTATDGSYDLLQLQPGGYIVKFSSGCGTTGYATQWWDNASSAGTGATVTVDPGASVNSIDASLVAG
jgi:hypothetical protein